MQSKILPQIPRENRRLIMDTIDTLKMRCGELEDKGIEVQFWIVEPDLNLWTNALANGAT